MDRIETEWCELNSSLFSWHGVKTHRLTFCNDFWKHFQWEQPEKKGDLMRFVFSRKYVRGAQKTSFRFDSEWIFRVRSGRVNQIVFTPVDELLDKLFDRNGARLLPSRPVWWWPEYESRGSV
jgi:hypothetical protein